MNIIRLAGALVLALCVETPVAAAHPIHTTLSDVSAQQGVVTITVRTFADDFSASVAAMAGKKPPADWSVVDADVVQYLAAHLRVVDARGTARPLVSCGIRRERDMYWLCLRVQGAADVRGLRAENRLLTERHTDQVNIVQVSTGSARKTLLFTSRTATLSLADD